MAKKKKKKPDIVVWDEKRGYYAKNLPYASDLGAPVIKADDVKGWRDREVVNVNHQFEAKYNELKEEYEKLLIEYELNKFIYSNVEYNFIPVIGHFYYLYEKNEGKYFISMIEPDQWNQKFLFKVRLGSDNKWARVIEKKD